MKLLQAAILPVIGLCYYIYAKDKTKEQPKLLWKLFGLGMLSCIPVIIVELILDIFFDTDDQGINSILMFINVFISVALVEEGFKWLITKKVGYDNPDFDEIYDIIVYSVFVSLGFACVENVGYVLLNGFSTAFFRALLALPGHTCFAVLMGYYFANAKLDIIKNGPKAGKRNLVLSLLVPTFFHTTYDALLLIGTDISIITFFIFDIIMVVYCFILVRRVAKMDQDLSKVHLIPVGVEPYSNVCPKCGSNESGDICSKCGTSLKPEKNVSSIVCANCGNVESGDVCSKCGLRIR